MNAGQTTDVDRSKQDVASLFLESSSPLIVGPARGRKQRLQFAYLLAQLIECSRCIGPVEAPPRGTILNSQRPAQRFEPS